MSLRIALLTSILTSTLFVWGLAGYLSFVDTQQEMDALFDAHLSETAFTILRQAEHEHNEGKSYPEETSSDDEDDHEIEAEDLDLLLKKDEVGKSIALSQFIKKKYFQLWAPSQRLLLNSNPELGKAPLAGEEMVGFSDISLHGVPLRVFSVWNKARTLNVQIAESIQARTELAKASVKRVLKPILLMIIPLLLFLTFSIEYIFRPFRALSLEIKRRSGDDLTAISEFHIPSEIKPFIQSINGLFARLARVLENERRFTADAAHELRTPLAAIKVQAQVAIKNAHDEAAHTKALDGVIEGIGQASHLVEQLLTMARLDPETELVREPIDLKDLVIDVASAVAPLALEKKIDFGMDESKPIHILGHRPMLEVLIRNLLDNAIRYTPQGGRVSIRIDEHLGHAELSVTDNGCGLSDRQKSLVASGQIRISRASGDGSGMGLSIVRRISDLHGAEFLIGDSLNSTGTVAKLIFPA